MNKLMIIGNLTRDPEVRTVSSGYTVCDFTVAVNNMRRSSQNNQNQSDGQNDATFFRVSAWNKLGENCAQYLKKGRKVCVIGSVTAHTYTGSDGTTRVSLDVNANEVEFLSSRNDTAAPYGEGVPTSAPAPQAPTAQNNGFTSVEVDDLPF